MIVDTQPAECPSRSDDGAGRGVDGRSEAHRLDRGNAQKAYILENSHSPAATFSPRGTLNWANRGFERLIGRPAAELAGASFVQWLDGREENRSGLARLRRATLRGEPVDDLEFRLRNSSGRLLWLAVDVHPLFEDGRICQFAVVGFDVTERKRNETLKTDFVSLVGHELRTPLTVVSGALEAMAGGLAGRLDPSMLELVEMGQRNCTRLRRLIENLLDVNRIETGVVTYQLQDLSVRQAVEHVARVLSLEVEQAGLALDIHGVSRVEQVVADPMRFDQVLTQLLSNAIKFSAPGKDIVIRSVSTASGSVRVSVTDQGPGIKPEFASQVFEKFTRDPDVLASGVEGFGLGLSIARALVASMNGRIGYQSNDGPGCEFWFELPRVGADARSTPEALGETTT